MAPGYVGLGGTRFNLRVYNFASNHTQILSLNVRRGACLLVSCIAIRGVGCAAFVGGRSAGERVLFLEDTLLSITGNDARVCRGSDFSCQLMLRRGTRNYCLTYCAEFLISLLLQCLTIDRKVVAQLNVLVLAVSRGLLLLRLWLLGASIRSNRLDCLIGVCPRDDGLRCAQRRIVNYLGTLGHSL